MSNQEKEAQESIDKLLETIEDQSEQAERLTQAMSRVSEQGEKFRRILQPVIETQSNFQQVLDRQKGLFDAFEFPKIGIESGRLNVPKIPSITMDLGGLDSAKLFGKGLFDSFELPKIGVESGLLSSLTKQTEGLFSSIEGILNPGLDKLHKAFQELPQQTQKALIVLGTHGWYLDLEMPVSKPWQLEDLITNGNLAEAEDFLIEYFSNRLDEIEVSITKKFPARKGLMASAFGAHRRHEYDLSIPVFLAQTDGICKELVNESLFMKKDRKPRTATYVEQLTSDTYMRAILSPLAQTLPISASERERAQGFSELNRHMVLHGESLDYGTQKNSLKAVSLINYVVHALTGSTEPLEES